MEQLYTGFDGLDVAFKCHLTPELLAQLAEGREAATQARAEQKIDLGGVVGLVAETGARGGFRYRLDTGDDGEVWFFKELRPGDEWGVRVSVKSMAFLVHGYQGVKARLYDRLKAWGVTRPQESVGRVDIACDFRLEGMDGLEPKAMVAHSHAKVMTYSAEDPGDRWEVAAAYKGRRCLTLTVGKMPGRQVQLYDKRAEAIERRKFHWFDAWGVEDFREDKRPVWRCEVRFGKTYLKERCGITSFCDFEAAAHTLAARAMEQVRYTDPEDSEPNATRRALHPCWGAIGSAYNSFLQGEGMRAGGQVEPRKVRGRRSQLRQQYASLMVGLVGAYAALHRLTDLQKEQIGHGYVLNEMFKDCCEIMEDDPRDFLGRVKRASNRMEVCEDEHDARGLPPEIAAETAKPDRPIARGR